MPRYFYLLLLMMFALSCITQKTTKVAEEITVPAKPDAYFNGTVIRDNINIRSNSSTSGSVLGTVNDGEQVRVLQNNQGWYEIVTTNNTRGWVRSDFIGTESLSYDLKVETFVDSILKKHDIEMFIDENDPYAVIYLVLPADQYSDKSRTVKFVKELGALYQKNVYPGQVEVRILNRDKKSVFTEVNLSKKGAVNLKAPFLLQGRPYSFQLLNGNEIKIEVLIPAGLSDDILYEMSHDISSGYGNQIEKVEIYFIEDSADGLAYLSKNNYQAKKDNPCRFYYLEDSNGPDYKSNFCN